MKRLRVNGGAGQQDIPLVGTIAVGRDERCAISTVDARLSRRHAEFFVDSKGFAWVRDVSSLNGVRVNNLATRHALLVPGDVVEVADLRIEFLDDEPLLPDVTAGWTRVVGAPEKQPSVNAAEGGFGVPSSPAPQVSARAAATAVIAQPDVEPTMRLAPSPNPEGPEPRLRVRRPAPAVEDPLRERHRIAALRLAPRPLVSRPMRPVRDGAWRSQVLVTFAAVALLSWTAAAAPSCLIRESEVGAIQASHAIVLARWLAGDAARALEHGDGDTSTLDALVARPAVTAARILRPDGQVLAPSLQMNQAVTSIPGFGVTPADVRGEGATLVAGEIQALSPVITKNGRVAVVWITIPGDGGRSMLSDVSLAGSCVATFVVGLLGAVVVHRRTLSGLKRLSEDVDLATRGEIDRAGDPLGIAPLGDIADAVNYLAENVRSSRESRPRPRAAADAPARPPAAPARDGARSVRRPHEVSLMANEQLRIVELGPGANLFLQPPASIGAHLVDAFAESAINDGVLTCIARLKTEAPARVALPATAARSALTIVVDRQENAHIRVILRETQE